MGRPKLFLLRFKRALTFLAVLIVPMLLCASKQDADLIIFSYHNIVANESETKADSLAVTSNHLASHFSWIKKNGYVVVGLDQVLAARQGGTPLPKKAVMLTFDDGLKSHYERVLPLLKVFRFKALFAVVPSWADLPYGAQVPYDYVLSKRSDFMTWDHLREAVNSGLVEVASHTFDFHKEILANPQGNHLPAVVARQYHAGLKIYESDSERFDRLHKDFEKSSQLIHKQLGVKPRSMVWPFGRYNTLAIEAARKAGFQAMFGLGGERNALTASLEALPRTLLSGNPDEASFAKEFLPLSASPLRAMQVELEGIYDKDAAQCEKKLGMLLDRVKASGVNTVFLKAFADPEGNGSASELFFPNRHLPVRCDLFSRVAWQLQGRCGVSVYAWMPLLGFCLPEGHCALKGGSLTGRRLSPHSPVARKVIAEVYEDLASSSVFSGLLFYEDERLPEEEKLSSPALKGLEASCRPKAVSLTVTEFSLEVASVVRKWQPEMKTARKWLASALLDKQGPEPLVRFFEHHLSHYDYAIVMAPSEKSESPDPFPELDRMLGALVTFGQRAIDKTLLEFQTTVWRTGKPISSKLIAQRLEKAQLRGIKHLGYSPDDVAAGHPELKILAPWFSMCRLPEGPPVR